MKEQGLQKTVSKREDIHLGRFDEIEITPLEGSDIDHLSLRLTLKDILEKGELVRKNNSCVLEYIQNAGELYNLSLNKFGAIRKIKIIQKIGEKTQEKVQILGNLNIKQFKNWLKKNYPIKYKLYFT